jgi:hypothetical protein
MEIYKTLEWYEWLYEVSNLGNVKSFQRWREKILKSCIKQNRWNYAHIVLSKNNIKTTYRIHRLVWKVFLWLDINDMNTLVCHKNDIPNDNRVDNLFLWTHSDNNRDCVNKWRHYAYSKYHIWKEHKASKQVNQYSLTWELIKIWDSIRIAWDNWFSRTWISLCCNWKAITSKWFKWSFN